MSLLLIGCLTLVVPAPRGGSLARVVLLGSLFALIDSAPLGRCFSLVVLLGDCLPWLFRCCVVVVEPLLFCLVAVSLLLFQRRVAAVCCFARYVCAFVVSAPPEYLFTLSKLFIVRIQDKNVIYCIKHN